jgi:hypothetical protein
VLLRAFLPRSACQRLRQGRVSILVLYANRRLLPANIDADRGLRKTIENSDPRAELSAEFLDYPHFDDEAYYHTVITFLSEKYAQAARRT